MVTTLTNSYQIYRPDLTNHDSNFMGMKITIPLISRYKNINIMPKHINKFFSTESKKMEKFIGNLLNKTVVK